MENIDLGVQNYVMSYNFHFHSQLSRHIIRSPAVAGYGGREENKMPPPPGRGIKQSDVCLSVAYIGLKASE